ncbi:MAG: hypothetical protein LH468_02295 [Nocardioides sp.]|nr:hypothetical protein [Nocardioides sp.]
MADTAEDRRTSTQRPLRAPWVGLAVVLLVVAAAFLVPRLTGWEVSSRAPRSASDREVAPLHGLWEPKLLGPGTLPAVVIALLSFRYAQGLAERLAWRPLLALGYVAGLAWMLALALVDGTAGLSRQLGNPYEYLRTAREVTDVQGLLTTWTEHLPIDSVDAFVTHVSGHPPGALLFFVGLVRLGLGGDLAAGVVVTALAASTAVAVMVTLRTLGHEDVARRAAPFLVLTPAAVFMAVSADGLFAAVAAWGLACLAIGATRPNRAHAVAWSALAGLLLGVLVMMSYGLPLMGLLAVAVLFSARSWLPLPVAAGTALLVVLGFAVAGFAWWEAYPLLNDRYWDGIAADRPAAYWMWANLALLALTGGPLLGAGLARVAVDVRALWRDRSTVLLVVAASAAAVLAADLSRMSKAEVERIWVPFVPWLLISCTLLPQRWRRWGLGLQLLTALLVQHLFYTAW